MQVMATIFGFTSHVVCTGGSSLHAVMRLCGGQAVGMIGNGALVGYLWCTEMPPFVD